MNDITDITTDITTTGPIYRMFYVPVGGVNYASIDMSDDITSDDIYDSIESAAQEWARRRNDWTGRFPCWGDGGDGTDTTAVIGVLFLQDDDDRWTLPCETVEGWSVAELQDHIGESSNYFDEPDDDDQDDEPGLFPAGDLPVICARTTRPVALDLDNGIVVTGVCAAEPNDDNGTVQLFDENDDHLLTLDRDRLVAFARDLDDDEDEPADDEPGTCIHHPDVTATHSNIGRLVDIHRDAVWHYCQPCADRFLTDQGRSTYRLV